MTINKTYTIDTLRQKALNVVSSIDADNIDKNPVFDSSFSNGYRWSESTLKKGPYYLRNASESFYINGYLKTNDTIPSNLKKSVSRSTVETNFKTLLNSRGFTNENFQGNLVSARTVQAIADTIVQYVVARYQIWMNAGGTKIMTLYDSGKVSYPDIEYSYKVCTQQDVVLKSEEDDSNGLSFLMDNVVNAGLSMLKVKRQPLQTGSIEAGRTCSSCSSSCSSSSCSSSSCSSSCSCSSVFIAYMKLS